MITVASYICHKFMGMIEEEFIKHTPEIQAAILEQLREFVQNAADWLDAKAQKQLEETSHE